MTTDTIDLPETILKAIETEARHRQQQHGGTLTNHRLEILGQLRVSIGPLIRHHGTEARAEGLTWVELAELLGYSSHVAARQAVDPQARARNIETAKRWQKENRVVLPPTPNPVGASVIEAAKNLGKSVPTVYNWVRAGKLEHTEVDGIIRVTDKSATKKR